MQTRREFVVTTASVLAATSLVACGLPADPSAAIVGPAVVRIALPAVGATVGVDGVGVGGQGIAVTRVSETSVVAVALQCTHQACPVSLPLAPGGNLICPCHGSQFTVQGAVVQGPALTGLRTFAATIDAANNQVVIANS